MNMAYTTILILLPTVQAVAFGGAEPLRVQAYLLDGRRIAGVVRDWRLEGEMEIQTAVGDVRRVPSGEIDRVDVAPRSPAAPSGPWFLETWAGDRLTGRIVDGDAQHLTMKHAPLGTLRIPFTELNWAAHQESGPRSRSVRDDQDEILLMNGDVAAGIVVAAGAETVTLNDGPTERSIRWDVIDALQMAPSNRRRSTDVRAAIELGDGTRLIATRLRWRSESVEATVADAQQVHFNQRLIHRVEVLGGKRVWLGSREPSDYYSTPYFSTAWPYRVGTNVVGGPLRLRGQTYPRGIGLHAACRIEWNLGGRFERFTALAGIDDSGGPLADADLIVKVDGRPVERIEGLRFAGAPKSIDLSVRDAKTLTVEVEFGLRGDVQDRVDLVNAALIHP